MQSLQQKEREENEIKLKLEHEHSVLLSKLVELGAARFVTASTAPPSPPPPGTTPTEIACPNEGLQLGLSDDLLQQISPSSKDLGSSEGEVVTPFLVCLDLNKCGMCLY